MRHSKLLSVTIVGLSAATDLLIVFRIYLSSKRFPMNVDKNL